MIGVCFTGVRQNIYTTSSEYIIDLQVLNSKFMNYIYLPDRFFWRGQNIPQ